MTLTGKLGDSCDTNLDCFAAVNNSICDWLQNGSGCACPYGFMSDQNDTVCIPRRCTFPSTATCCFNNVDVYMYI